jgi:hypothetical protein
MFERLHYMVSTSCSNEEWSCCSRDVGVIWDNIRTAVVQGNSTGLAVLLRSAEVRILQSRFLFWTRRQHRV